jgi:hypothetical protein
MSKVVSFEELKHVYTQRRREVSHEALMENSKSYHKYFNVMRDCLKAVNIEDILEKEIKRYARQKALKGENLDKQFRLCLNFSLDFTENETGGLACADLVDHERKKCKDGGWDAAMREAILTPIEEMYEQEDVYISFNQVEFDAYINDIGVNIIYHDCD